MTVTKAELAKNLFDKLGFSRNESDAFVRLFFEEIIKNLEQGKNVKVSGFGNFVLHNKRPRIGRNPKTGEAATISARRVVVFRPGQRLKRRIASNAGTSKNPASFSTDT